MVTPCCAFLRASLPVFAGGAVGYIAEGVWRRGDKTWAWGFGCQEEGRVCVCVAVTPHGSRAECKVVADGGFSTTSGQDGKGGVFSLRNRLEITLLQLGRSQEMDLPPWPA